MYESYWISLQNSSELSVRKTEYAAAPFWNIMHTCRDYCNITQCTNKQEHVAASCMSCRRHRDLRASPARQACTSVSHNYFHHTSKQSAPSQMTDVPEPLTALQKLANCKYVQLERENNIYYASWTGLMNKDSMSVSVSIQTEGVVLECSVKSSKMAHFVLKCNKEDYLSDKSSKMAHFVFKCNKEDYLSISLNAV